MLNLADRRVPDLPAGSTEAATQILILPEQEDRLVEPANVIEGIAPGDNERSDDVVSGVGRLVLSRCPTDA
jgi:hypothetical protein